MIRNISINSHCVQPVIAIAQLAPLVLYLLCEWISCRREKTTWSLDFSLVGYRDARKLSTSDLATSTYRLYKGEREKETTSSVPHTIRIRSLWKSSTHWPAGVGRRVKQSRPLMSFSSGAESRTENRDLGGKAAGRPFYTNDQSRGHKLLCRVRVKKAKHQKKKNPGHYPLLCSPGDRLRELLAAEFTSQTRAHMLMSIESLNYNSKPEN